MLLCGAQPGASHSLTEFSGSIQRIGQLMIGRGDVDLPDVGLVMDGWSDLQFWIGFTEVLDIQNGIGDAFF